MRIRENHEPLEAVLRAATAPAHPAELAGEQEAVAAFLAATPAPRRRSLLARILTVKALVIGGVAASTGVVLATASGVLPAPWPQRQPGPPADAPALTTTASLPAMTPPAGHPTAESEPADQDVPPPPSNARPCAGPCAGHEPDRSPDEPSRDDKPGKSDKSDRNSAPPTSVTRPTTSPPAPSSGTPRSPDSSAPGAGTAVTPNGAKPPTEGD